MWFLLCFGIRLRIGTAEAVGRIARQREDEALANRPMKRCSNRGRPVRSYPFEVTMTDDQLLTLIALTAERQRQAVTPNGTGGYSVDHIDPQAILEAFKSQITPE